MKLELPEYNYCPLCGGHVDICDQDGRKRPVCRACGHVIYVNPIPAACQVVLKGGDILLVLRAVEPHKGMWCLPGGFMEWGESPEEASKRELSEETGILAEELSLIGAYDSVIESSRHVLLLAHRVLAWSGEPVPGDDADDVRWFDIQQVPPLAFKAHQMVLEDALNGE